MKRPKSEIDALKNACIAILPQLVQALFVGRRIHERPDGLRIGNNGALAIKSSGEWFDHERGNGGDIFALIMHARRCGFSEAIAFAEAIIGSRNVSEVASQYPSKTSGEDRLKNRKKREHIASYLWQQSKPAGDEVEKYFLSRSIQLDRIPPNIRHLPRFEDRAKGATSPAIICGVHDIWGELRGVHITSLRPKKRQFFGSIGGHAIQLAPATNETLALAEGIEDALSVMQMQGFTCWATGTASNVPTIPENVKTILLCPDHDEAGFNWLKRARQQYVDQGKNVKVLSLPDGIKDPNDLLQMQRNPEFNT